MSKLESTNLKVKAIGLSAEFDLTPLLYSGGAAANLRLVQGLIAAKGLGEPRLERLSLVEKIVETLDARLTSGLSFYTARSNVNAIRAFYAWSDDKHLDLDATNLTRAFVAWTDDLINKQRIQNRIKRSTVFDVASKASVILNEIADSELGLMQLTRVRKMAVVNKALGTSQEKQNLSDLTAQGYALLDIVRGLTTEKIRGPLPVMIPMRSGKVLEEWSGLRAENDLKPHTRISALKNRTKHINDSSWATRFPLINLRLEAELLIFITQTGMNFTQAHKLKVSKFSYQSDTGGYLVRRVYKKRSSKEVEFHIYSEYRTHFEEFLKWREAMFPGEDEGQLFPIRSPKNRPAHIPPQMGAIRKRFSKLGLTYVSPQSLRKARINWLLRRNVSESMVASMHQHSESTLLKNYLRPNHQIALVEVSRFFSSIEQILASPAPGGCIVDTPNKKPGYSNISPSPDCVNPSGCFFCENHRDIESFDHLWSLTTYKYCKILELSKTKLANTEEHPALLTIKAISSKIEYFKLRGDKTKEWSEEAEALVEEGEYHPAWEIFIKMMEN